MLKYIIAPKWLVTAAKANSIDFSGFLDFNIMGTILSPLELFFYIKSNLKTYENIFINKNTNSLFRLLEDKQCQNQIRAQKPFIHFANSYVAYPNRVDYNYRYMIDDPIRPIAQPSDSRNIYLKPILVGDHTLGFVPDDTPIQLDQYSIRRDIYALMHRYMSVYDIIQSPIFGI